jgi:hypothetical protein
MSEWQDMQKQPDIKLRDLLKSKNQKPQAKLAFQNRTK